MYFTAPTLSAGLTVTSYDYQLSRDGGATVYYSENTGTWPNSYGNTGATSSPYTDPNASSFCPIGTSCSWRIRADIGTVGLQSAWSEWVAMTSFGGAPSLDSVNYSNDGATMYFTAPTLSAGLTVTSYDYQLSRDGGATVYYSENTGTWPNSYGNTGATSSPYTDPNASSFCPIGTSCSWRIRADIGTVGLQSAWSEWVAMTSFGGAPSLDSVNYSNDGATMYFTAPTLSAGSDRHLLRLPAVAGWRRSHRPLRPEHHGSYASVYGNTGATASPYTDPSGSSLCPVGTSCSWRIRADIGTVGLQSAWSEWVTAGLPLHISAVPSSRCRPLEHHPHAYGQRSVRSAAQLQPGVRRRPVLHGNNQLALCTDHYFSHL